MGLYRQGKVWYMRLSVNGRLVRKSTGTDNKRLAEDIYAKMKIDRREGRFFQKDQGNKKTFRDMADKYMTEYAVKKAPKSMLRDTVSLRHLLPAFGDKYLSQVTPAQIASYKTRRRNEGASASSINKELAFAKHAFNIAIREWEWMRDNPFTRVGMERLPQPRVRYLTREEFKKLYQACNDRLKPIILFAVNTGIRQENILNLTWQDVDLSRGIITVQQTKNGERLGLPMNQSVKDLLSGLGKLRFIRSSHIFPNSIGSKLDGGKIRQWFGIACKKAGIENFRFHDLRHTAASWMVQKGVDLYIVQRILGHKTTAMTQRYAHLAPDNLRTGLNALDVPGTDIKTDIGADNGTDGHG